jgi:hypothetical protein
VKPSAPANSMLLSMSSDPAQGHISSRSHQVAAGARKRFACQRMGGILWEIPFVSGNCLFNCISRVGTAVIGFTPTGKTSVART